MTELPKVKSNYRPARPNDLTQGGMTDFYCPNVMISILSMGGFIKKLNSFVHLVKMDTGVQAFTDVITDLSFSHRLWEIK